MAFVNELIGEEDKKKIDWTEFKWWERSDPHRPWKWTIDRERDVFLVGLVNRGRDGDHPEIYALSWKGGVIRFSAESGGQGMFTTGVDMFWKVFDIEIPSHLEIQRQEILSVLVEAIDAHGSVYDRSHVKSVHVDFV
ncbi:MAG TPA: hypothetical protein VLC92_21450 [Rhodocyclaceae bacterium]|nr:hypothetical protein [Rhodocyclaceae bacterium]